MSKQESTFIRCFRLGFIAEREQMKVRQSLLKTKDIRQIIELTKRYDTLQRRRDLFDYRKLK